MGKFIVLLSSELVLILVGVSLLIGIFKPYEVPVRSEAPNVLVVYAQDMGALPDEAIEIVWEDLK